MESRDEKADPVKLHRWLIGFIGVIVPRRLRADWKQEWEAELRYREMLLADWDKLNWRTKLDLLRRSLGAFRDALLLQPQRLEDEMFQDLRYGVRGLLKKPGFTAAAVLTLAFGIGVNTAIFSVVNAFLFRPLPVKDSHQLAVLATQDNHSTFPHGMSYQDYLDYRKLNDVFSDLILYLPAPVSLSSEGQAERIWVEVVTANYFSVLGVNPLQGRLLAPEDDRAPSASPVMVLSHAFWQQRFGGDASVVGRTVQVNSHPFTIVGVTPETFRDTEAVIEAEAYVPAMMLDQVMPGSGGALRERDNHLFRAMGRLKPGVSVEQARAAANNLALNLGREHPTTNKNVSLMVVPETMARPEPSTGHLFRPAAGLFMILVGLVLLIACANVANLLLVRGMARGKELAIRSALGASRARIVRQLLTESALLGAAGAGAGLMLAHLAMRYLSRFSESFPSDIPLDFDFSLDWRVFAFTLALAVLTSLVAGLLPALRGSRPRLQEMLKEGGRGSAGGAGHHRLRNLLVVAQVAVSLMLLVSAGLFMRSLSHALQMDLGFRTDNLLLLSVDPGLQGYDEARRAQFYRQVSERVKSLPGVDAVSWATFTPMGIGTSLANLYVEGSAPVAEGETPSVFYTSTDIDYFQTIGMPILQGRAFTERDDKTAKPVAVINQAMAERFWPGEDPIGKRLRLNVRDGAPMEVVGVTKTSKYLLVLEDPLPFLYLPLRQSVPNTATLHVHAQTDPLSLLPSVRAQLRALDAEMPIYDVKTLASHLRDGNAFLLFRMGALLAGTFGVVGLLLAMIGVYGVISYAVTERTHEIGVRLALGARRGDVFKMVIGRGMLLALAGVGAGLAGAFVLTRFLSTLLLGVSATDPLTFVSVSLILTLIALLANYLPARRAARVDPMVALRSE